MGDGGSVRFSVVKQVVSAVPCWLGLRREGLSMLTSLRVTNFRLFRDLQIDTLSRVNLIAGENNSGKTVLLEALHLLFGGTDELSRLPSVFRASQGTGSDNFKSFWMWLFHRRQPGMTFFVQASDSWEEYRVRGVAKPEDVAAFNSGQPLQGFNLEYIEGDSIIAKCTVSGGHYGSAPSPWLRSTVFSVHPSTPVADAERFNRVAAKRDGRQKVVELLRVIEPRLKDLDYLRLGTEPLVYADLGLDDFVPTTQLGQGFTRLLSLFSEAIYSQSGIILIDEVESGIHYSVMGQVWKGIAAIAREQDLQVFATTHSYECIRAAHEAFSSLDTYDLTVHRLERVGEEVKVASYDRVALETSIDMNLEVR